MTYQLALNWDDFLATYWQKKPVVLRQALAPFVDPLTADELAGMAMEEQIDSRLVSRCHGQWQVAHGPFTSFDELGETDWSLLVQAVDHWHPQAAELMEQFRQLPNWRLDDLMISFSVPGGGVGPHIDQYDVFIIQGMGRRRWRVGDRGQHPQHCPTPGLLQVPEFEPLIDVELEAGDILYIPPGFPHDGYALTPALNYSVGFRAPNQRELFSQLADQLLAQDGGNRRYADPDLTPRSASGCVTSEDVQRLRELMSSLLDDEAFACQLVQSLSEAKHELDLEPVDPPYAEGEILDLVLQDDVVLRLGGLRAFYLQQTPGTCFIHGEQFAVPAGAEALMRQLCDHTQLATGALRTALEEPAALAWFTMLINTGYWYFASDWQAEEVE